MTYEKVLSSIHSRRTFSGGGPTLERIGRLMNALGNPQEDYRCVHVAGTNGKGSLCAFMNSILLECGYRVGMFTSPYLRDFRERIQVCGEMISRELLVECYETVMEQEYKLESSGYEPVNEFELVTAIGFLAFSRMQVDYVVLEVGLGGKSDPTNLITKPAVSCIMPVSLDHTAILGDTIPEIAGEKAGIIKPGCPVVMAKQLPEAREVFCKTAKAVGARLCETEDFKVISAVGSGSSFLYRGEIFKISLLGAHQIENALVAIGASSVLELPLDQVRSGLKKAVWPGRLQLIPGSPEILIDAGHNAAGIDALIAALDQLFPGRRIVSVVAMMRDKDYSYVLPEIARRSRILLGTTVGLPRSLPPEEIKALAGCYCQAYSAETISSALEMAEQMADQGDLILVCGSVYAAGEALNQIL